MSIKDQIISVMNEVVNFEHELKEREQKQKSKKFCEALLKEIQKGLEFLCNKVLPDIESPNYVRFIKDYGYRFFVIESKNTNDSIYLLKIKGVITENSLIDSYNELNKVMYMNEELTDFARKNDLYTIEITKSNTTYFWEVFVEIEENQYKKYDKFLSEHKA